MLGKTAEDAWIERQTNLSVLIEIGTTKSLIATIIATQLQYFG